MYFNHWEYTLNATPYSSGDNVVYSQPGHVTPDNHCGSLSTRSDTSRFESVDSDKEETSSDVHLLRHASKKIQNWDEQMILLLSQVSWVGMLGTTLDYLAKIGQLAITIEVFHRKESDGTPFSKFITKWWKATSSMAIISSLEK